MEQLNALASSAPGPKALLRVDCQMLAPSGSSLLMDWTTIHETAPSYRKQSSDWYLMHSGCHFVPAPNKTSSSVITDAQLNKHRKYRPLMHLLKLQKLSGQRNLLPDFCAPVVSHLGEFSTDVYKAINWLAPIAYRSYKDNKTLLPFPLKTMLARYRREIMNSLAVASAKGCAMMLMASGNPL